MKKILAAALLAFALLTAHSARASEERLAPTEPPAFVPGLPVEVTPSPVRDLDRLMQLLSDGEEKKPVKLACTSRPCVFGYRLNGGITEEAKDKFEAFINAATEAHADAVMVEINTPGGSIDEGHEISRMIEHAPLMVACVVDGTSYSMGMYILQSCDVRVMTKRSSLMIHQASLIIRGGARLTQPVLDELKVRIEVTTRSYIEWVAHRMRVSVKDVLARVANGGEWYMNWNEALKTGAVDKVISDPPEAYFQLLKRGLR